MSCMHLSIPTHLTLFTSSLTPQSKADMQREIAREEEVSEEYNSGSEVHVFMSGVCFILYS